MIVEMARRCPGDLYSRLVEYTTGFRYAAKYASYFLGETITEQTTQRRHILRHTVTADKESYFEGVVFPQNQSVNGFFPLVPMGEELRARQGNRVGILFTETSNYPDLIDAYQRFLDRKTYRVAELSQSTGRSKCNGPKG